MEGLKQGNDVLKEIHKETSIEAVEKLMDDTAEAIAYQNVCEISLCDLEISCVKEFAFRNRKLMKCWVV